MKKIFYKQARLNSEYIKIALGLLLVLMVALIGVGYWLSHRALIDSSFRMGSRLAQVSGSNEENKLKNLYALVDIGARDFDRLLKMDSNWERINNYVANRNDEIEKIVQNKDVLTYVVVNGKIMGSDKEIKYDDVNYRERIWYQKAKENPGKLIFTDSYTDIITGYPVITLARYNPLNDVCYAVDFVRRSFAENKDADKMMQGSFHYLIDTHGNLFYYMSRIDSPDRDHQAFAKELWDAVQRGQISMETKENAFTDVDGDPCRAYIYRLEGGWLSVVTIKEASLLRYLKQLRYGYFFVILGFLIVLAGAARFMWKLYHQDKYLQVVNSITSLFYCNYYIDLKADTYQAFIEQDDANSLVGSSGKASAALEMFNKYMVRENSQSDMESFLDLQTLPERLLHSDVVDCEYQSVSFRGWCRAKFIVVERDIIDVPSAVIFVVESIDESKRRELDQAHELQRSNVLLKNQSEIVRGLVENYYVVTFIDVTKDHYNIISRKTSVEDVVGLNGKSSVKFAETTDRYVVKEYRPLVYEFTNLDTISDRMKNTDLIACEYIDKRIGWVRADFMAVKRDQFHKVEKVLFTLRNIQAEKERDEQHQLALVEVQNMLAQEKAAGKELSFKADHDFLTKSLNRSGFDKVVNSLRNTDEKVGFILLDIDSFKSINDTYGHEVGDKVLVKVAKLLKDSFRSTDFVVRFGGDEFAIILRDYKPESTRFVVDKITRINDKLANCETTDLPKVSVSAGVAFSDRGFDEQLYKNADSALYQIKESGKHGCQIFQARGGKA